jgi:acetamidase/formamidase
MLHTLPISTKNLHGVFSRKISPALTIEPGDTVCLSTLDAWWATEPMRGQYATRATFDHPHNRRGHALSGPIAVRGLGAGDWLEVRVDRLVPELTGFTECGGYPSAHYQRFSADEPPPRMLLWSIDGDWARTTLESGREVRVRCRPFLGVMGMPPAASGEHSTTPPRRTGGNLDCSLLTEGAALFLPAEVDGGLLAVGDGHAAQGDGEVSNNGIECGMKEVRLTLTRHPASAVPEGLTMPFIRLAPPARGFAAIGLGSTLDEAASLATDGILRIIAHTLGCTRKEALGLASVSADLRVTQLVNGTVGVHAVWHEPPSTAP